MLDTFVREKKELHKRRECKRSVEMFKLAEKVKHFNGEHSLSATHTHTHTSTGDDLSATKKRPTKTKENEFQF